MCQKYLYQKLSKSDRWFASYSRKCRGCFLRHSVVQHESREFFEISCEKKNEFFRHTVRKDDKCLQ